MTCFAFAELYLNNLKIWRTTLNMYGIIWTKKKWKNPNVERQWSGLYVTQECVVSEPKIKRNNEMRSNHEKSKNFPNYWLVSFIYTSRSILDTRFICASHITEAVASIRSKGHWSKVIIWIESYKWTVHNRKGKR